MAHLPLLSFFADSLRDDIARVCIVIALPSRSFWSDHVP
jgi:hypothetical protein